jgi:8-oxo-dGTP pyrophosphatase MutT (NUDIX family)
MQKERFKMPATAHLIVENDGRVLLPLRKNTGYMSGYYGLIGGHVENGEFASEAIIREAREEAGIILSPDDMKPVHAMHYKNKTLQYACFFFKLENYAGEVRNTEPEKCAGMEWFKKEALPENTVPLVKHLMESLERGESYSEYSDENP